MQWLVEKNMHCTCIPITAEELLEPVFSIGSTTRLYEAKVVTSPAGL
jgi:hypothetical protein